jgi:hypothetical protein
MTSSEAKQPFCPPRWDRKSVNARRAVAWHQSLLYYHPALRNNRHSREESAVRSPASPNVVQPVERAVRAGVVVGLIALVLEGAFAILPLAAVISTRQAAISVRALFLPRLGRSH